ncbi:hypothetical protein PUNSTDRAFT_137645 [Punctularia strigosozonata HHB-11173 SS5]|uniref:uncharacterized protein n=1 Tax=Punctularia strigosozonata (strain HHB-11173) TaxID=741275 RepID=UPI00044181A0|nr:uncharacterized protein PUNSTDRAFT_137645 [Punctularia strigosozonata HHB-11173 SS5]EIN05539.1 hypothetical protein PUNSTDRAFT_137645 [Punctularia strigosozonata HHB-11173 SS5]
MPPWVPNDEVFERPHYRLNRKELVELAHALGLDGQGTITELKACTKQALRSCIDQLINHPVFTNLCTAREKTDYEQERGQEEEEEDPWQGIEEAPRDAESWPGSDSLSSQSSGHTSPSPSPVPRLTGRILTQHPGPPRNAAPQCPPASSAPLKGHPAREPGVLADLNYYVIPPQIVEIFEKGYRKHVPLHHLTDAACAAQGIDTMANLTNLWRVEAGSLVPIQQSLSAEGELRLSFAEWLQAWQRFLQLIEDYLTSEYEDRHTHHNFIRCRPGASSDSRWPVWLSYDIEIRRCRLRTPIDPREFHRAIWDDLYIAHLGQKVTQITPQQA